MVVSVDGDTCVDAWRNAVRVLMGEHAEIYNLLVTIARPTYFDPIWMSTFNPASARPGSDQIRGVANTIFPKKLARFSATRSQLYQKYARAIRLGKLIGHNTARNRSAWGTYFGRLINFGRSNKNQLEQAIMALQKWPKRQKAAITFHLTSAETDGYRTRGGPCWQFAEINYREGNTLDLIVIYRNHDYFNKALGNFIGLGQLLEFICSQTRKRPGRIVCHSVRAYYDVAIPTMRQIARL